MRRARVFAHFLMAAFLVCLTSCNKYSPDIPLFEQEYPDMVMNNATYTLYKDGSKPISLNAEAIEVYSSSQKAVFSNASFTQEDSLSGTCSKVSVIDNERITLSQNVIIEKKSDNAKINCGKLDWNNASGNATASNPIIVSFSDDSIIEAEVLKTNLNENTYRFEKISKAQFKNSDESLISIYCDNLSYDSDNEKVVSDGKVTIDDSERKAKITGARLVYDKNEALITLSLQAKCEKETDKGLLSCTSESMVYNTDNQTLTIIGNAKVVWDKDSYRASIIIVDLNTDKVTLIGPVSGEMNG